MWIWERCERFVDKFAFPLLSLLSIYVFARSVAAGTGKIYWYDELLTELVVAQGSLSKMMAALRAPLDGQPPLFYLIERLASKLAGNEEIALRSPSAMAMAFTTVCVYVFLRRTGDRLVALLGAMFLMTTVVFSAYAAEARPYGLLVGCIAFALVCYQRVPSLKWNLLLGASLALAQSFYYMAVLSFVPFAFAELYENLQVKRMRWGVWAAFAAGALPLAFSWKLLALNKAYYGANHVALGFNFAKAVHSYGDLLDADGAIGIGMATLAAAGLAMVWTSLARESDDEAAQRQKNELVLIAGFLGLPIIAYVFAQAAHAPMAPRYFLPSVLGVLLSFAVAAARMPQRAKLFFAVYVLATVGFTELHFWRSIAGEKRELSQRGPATAKILESAGYSQLPVVVPNGDVLWVVRYAFPDSPQRFVHLTKDQDGPGDTRDKGLALAQKYVPIQVSKAGRFISENPQFIIYTEGDSYPNQWVNLRMLQERWSVELLAADGLRAVYLARKTQSADRAERNSR